MSFSSCRSLIQMLTNTNGIAMIPATPEHNHGRDEHGHEPGVNRMAHERARTARNQFVAALEGHNAAPI